MNIVILCSDRKHPVVRHLKLWVSGMTAKGHKANLVFEITSLHGGDMLFLVSCSEIVTRSIRSKFRHTLVLHASNLPSGRGWSPHIWAIIRGSPKIDLCLLEAGDKVDTGDIWFRAETQLKGNELLPEINAKLFSLELELMTRAVNESATIMPVPQVGELGPYEPRRTPKDSRLDPHMTIAEQFNVLRVVDNERYPAFFDHLGSRYVIKITKHDI